MCGAWSSVRRAYDVSAYTYNYRIQIQCQHATKTRCLLLKLPGELRNRIYYFLLERSPTRIWLLDGQLLPHALARTCRQLRGEFLPLHRSVDLSKVKKIFAVLDENQLHLIEDFMDRNLCVLEPYLLLLIGHHKPLVHLPFVTVYENATSFRKFFDACEDGLHHPRDDCACRVGVRYKVCGRFPIICKMWLQFHPLLKVRCIGMWRLRKCL